MPHHPTPDEIAEAEAQGYLIPPRAKPATDAGYFSILAQATFQAGFSWKVVRNKWPNFIKAFDGFDIERVATYSADDVDRLVSDQGIVRNGRKIEAVIANARTLREIIRQHGSFHAYLRLLDGQSYAQRRKALIKRFKWLGSTGVFFFLWCVDEDVPRWEDRHK
jgi:3-methyladenine DNA glycosylase Tag